MGKNLPRKAKTKKEKTNFFSSAKGLYPAPSFLSSAKQHNHLPSEPFLLVDQPHHHLPPSSLSPSTIITASVPLNCRRHHLLWSWSSRAASVPLRSPVGSASSLTDRYHHHHLPFLAELFSSSRCLRLLVQGLNSIAMGRWLLTASTLRSRKHSPCSLSGELQQPLS